MSQSGNLSLGQRKYNIVWLGSSGMRWENLHQTIQCQMIFRTKPAAILIHLGGNSIDTVKQESLMQSMSNDLNYICDIFNSSLVVYCDILPRLIWRDNHSDSPTVLNSKARRINRHARQTIRQIKNGQSLQFRIHESMPELFNADGVHLSQHGNLLYTQTLKRFIMSLN